MFRLEPVNMNDPGLRPSSFYQSDLVSEDDHPCDDEPSNPEKYLNSSLALPSSWIRHPDDYSEWERYSVNPDYFPFNKHIYEYALGVTPCECLHIVHPSALTKGKLLYYNYAWPCGCRNPKTTNLNSAIIANPQDFDHLGDNTLSSLRHGYSNLVKTKTGSGTPIPIKHGVLYNWVDVHNITVIKAYFVPAVQVRPLPGVRKKRGHGLRTRFSDRKGRRG